MTQTYVYATPDQIKAAVNNISYEDYCLLCRRAQSHIGGTMYSEGKDLLHEALIRCLDGRRNWPISMPFENFLFNCLKSIASADRKSLVNRNVKTENHFESLGYDALSILSPKSPSVEDLYIRKEQLHQLLNLKNQFKAEFVDDPQAQMIIDSWGTDLTPVEITAKLGCLRNGYRAALARVDRKVQAHRRKRPNL